eukprot:NODE_1784_length_841_cov_177.614899_g1408_i0.p1 GENE.NODE_1784_length_841_cov_177.614899_g1408_i0~~NODE_1784_length_841_cov_177.614899_g1408_i0.p1  ORF type:complete len:137 (-),score=33.80 NODE_1784_length_841_cov_177.614899_g1408_i0:356-766(-)
MILAGWATQFASSVLLVWCGYQSYQSIETASWKDDAHWLTFWLLYSFLSFLEMVLDPIMYKLPFWYEAQLCVLVYLSVFGGAQTIYAAIGKRAILAVEGGVKELGQNEKVAEFAGRARAQSEYVKGRVQGAMNKAE